MTNKAALITGITGQDGSYLAEFLLNKGYNVIGLARSQQYLHNIKDCISRIRMYYGDILDSQLFTTILLENNINEVYNFAAVSHIEDCWNNSLSSQVNSIAPISMLDTIRRLAPKTRFFQATSREIFGNTPGLLNEESRFSTENPYATAKLWVHLMIDAYRKKYGVYACSGIMFNHESPRRPTKFVTRKVTNFVANIKTGQEAKLKLGNLDTRRDWGYAPDFVRGAWLMLQQPEADDYVLATGKTYSIRELCEIAFSSRDWDYTSWIEADASLVRANEVLAPIGNYNKIKNKLGWEPSISFEEMIKIMVEADL